MKPVRHRFQTEVHLGILALIFLLLFLNFTSNFLIHAVRSSKRSAVAAHFAEAGQAVSRAIAEYGKEAASGERQSELLRTHGLEALIILPSAPGDDSAPVRRKWFGSVAHQFPPDMVPIVARQVVEAEIGKVQRGPGAEYYMLRSIETAEGRIFVLMSRTERELARLDDIYRLALIMSLIALIATAAVYVILSRLIFAPFRKAKAEAVTAGRAMDGQDDDVEALLGDYRRMIDELRQKERELLRLNENIRLRADSLEQFNKYLLESMQSGIVTVDRKGIIRTVNEAAGRILSITIEGSGERRYEDLLPRDLAETVGATLSTTERGDYREVALEVAGETRVLGVAASIVMNGGEEAIGAALLINDVTEVTHLREQLERRVRLAALGEMSGGLAHQLRNSLGAISGYLNLLRKRLQKRGVEESAVEELVDEAAQADSLVRRFLEFARPLAVDPQAVALPQLVQQTVTSFGMREEYPGIEVVVGAVPDVTVSADVLLLRQVLVNLIENAANSYGQERGVIRIEGELAGDEVVIRVRDWGCGIAPEVVGKIFTPFYSSRPSGTGLGLSLVSKIVDLHKGRVELDSKLGEGSVFTVILPLEATVHPPERFLAKSPV